MRLSGSRAYYRPTPPKMPPGLVELMEGLSKEVLMNNPTDIFGFCAGHMQRLLEIRDGPSLKKPLSLDKKISKAQEKVRRKAEKRRQQYDRDIQLHEQDKSKDAADVTVCNNIVEIESVQEQTMTQNVTILKEQELTNSSEIEISHERFVENEHEKGKEMLIVIDDVMKPGDINISERGYEETVSLNVKELSLLNEDNDSILKPVGDCLLEEGKNESKNNCEEQSTLKTYVTEKRQSDAQENVSMASDENLAIVTDQQEFVVNVELKANTLNSEEMELTQLSRETNEQSIPVDVNSNTVLNTMEDKSQDTFPKSNENETDVEIKIEYEPHQNENIEQPNFTSDDSILIKNYIYGKTPNDKTIINFTNCTEEKVVIKNGAENNKSDDIKEVDNEIDILVTGNASDDIKIQLEEVKDISRIMEDVKKTYADCEYPIITSKDDEECNSATLSTPDDNKTNTDNKLKQNHHNELDVTSSRVTSSKADDNSNTIDKTTSISDSIIKIAEHDSTDNNTTTTKKEECNNGSHSQNNMDLETAAVTIQKVFRTFLFKSRASTFEDNANDEDSLFDDDNDKKENDFSITTALSKERRPHGITRMDTVLQTVNEEKSLSLSTDDSSTLSSAATIIQAHVRGFLVRNKLNSNKTHSTNSLVASNSNNPSLTSLENDNEQLKNKTVLNIHIVPEGSNLLSRDESLITSVDLSLDGSPPSSFNLQGASSLGFDISERRKLLKREDAIQSVSPPSNNSGKLSEDVDSVRDLLNNDNATAVGQLQDDTARSDVDEQVISVVATTDVSDNVVTAVASIEDMSTLPSKTKIGDKDIKQKRTLLVKTNSDEMDVVTPFIKDDIESAKNNLMHSGEFHDAVLPTKVSRSDTSVVRGE